MLSSTRRQGSRWLIALPCYNNAAMLGDVLADVRALAQTAAETGRDTDILVIDDGSTDGIDEVLAGAKIESLAVIRHDRNRGKGAAIASAVGYARESGEDYIALVTVDADGQHTREAIAQLLIAAAAEPSSLWLGARRMDRRENPAIPRSSVFGRRFSNGWVAIETGRWLSDTQTGLRSYPLSADFYDRVAGISCRHYDFEIAVLVKSLWAGVTVRETLVPVRYTDDRVSHFHGLRDNARLSLLHSRLVAERILVRLPAQLLRPLGRAVGIAPGAERKGSRLTGWVMARGGKAVCVVLAIFPVSFYFLADRRAREGIATLYRRLGLSNRAFKNFWWFALSIIDRLDFAKGERRLPELAKSCGTTTIEPGSVVLASHIGDWLFGGLSLSAKASKLAILVDEGRTPEFLKQLKNAAALPVALVDSRQEPIQLILGLRDILAAGGVVCVMADRLAPGNTPVHQEFLGERAAFPGEPFRLAHMLAAPVYAFCATRSRGGIRAAYTLRLRQLAASAEAPSPEALLTRYISFLEEQLATGPQHWFNFFNFWKTA